LLPGGAREEFNVLRGRRGVAFAGIADPEAFFASLRDKGVEVVATVSFGDHCHYGEPEILRLQETCRTAGADYLITTGKDAVKLAPCLGRLGTVYGAALEMQLVDSAPLEAAIDKVL
jgi:tetraacyldisaccharide 4'-kinase